MAIQPLTARSVLLSTLLGYHPPELPVSALVRVAALFGIAEGTTRAALSRLVAAGDVAAADGTFPHDVGFAYDLARKPTD